MQYKEEAGEMLQHSLCKNQGTREDTTVPGYLLFFLV